MRLSYESFKGMNAESSDKNLLRGNGLHAPLDLNFPPDQWSSEQQLARFGIIAPKRELLFLTPLMGFKSGCNITGN
jgi:hypothetical protein